MTQKKITMKIALLGARNSHLSGGLYNSVRCLGLALYHKGTDVKLFSFDDRYSKEDLYAYGELPIIKYHRTRIPILKQYYYSSDLIGLLENDAPDIIHSQAVWLYTSYATRHFERNNKAKIIITPRGTLDPWALKVSKIKKGIIKRLVENDNFKNADCFHALNVSEYKSIRAYGLTNPVAIIPNGINLPKNEDYDRNKVKKVLLFVGRINPKKGIAELLDALKIIKDDNPELMEKWVVRIAGWDQRGHLEYLKAKCIDLGLDKYVSFIGPVLGDEKAKEHLKADAFVLASYSEGLPMSVLEAWSYKLPVVMTDQCNLPDGFENNAAIRVTTDSNSIAEGLTRLFSMKDEERIMIGENGYNLVKREYTWDGIADKTIQLYKWLLNGGEKPAFVKLD